MAVHGAGVLLANALGGSQGISRKTDVQRGSQHSVLRSWKSPSGSSGKGWAHHRVQEGYRLPPMVTSQALTAL